MNITKINHNWKFWEITNSFALNWDPPKEAVLVDLPHDAMIETPQDPDAKAGANTGYRKGGVYSYSKTLRADDPEKAYILRIEGAYMNAFVYVNGQLAGKRPFGYSVFFVFLNDYLNFGEDNEIRIQVRAGAEPNSRWYPGNGLYRDVYLLESSVPFIRPDNVMIKTISIPGNAAGQTPADNPDNALIEVSSMIAVKEPDEYSLEITITDPWGDVAGTRSVRVSEYAYTDESASSYLPDAFVFLPVTAQVSIPSPCLWDVDTPYLYQCSLTLKDVTGKPLDTHADSFGIRVLDLSPEEGLKVNGQPVKLRGACIHHDSGILGAKTYEEVHIRQIRKLKEAGFNAIRCAHNPAAPALLRACDKVGMYVMDEAFDVWTRHKSDYDYGMYFDEWWEADVQAMAKDAYNHPCVLMYSIGNEIPEIGTKQGGEITREICEVIRSLDDTRYTLASVNGIFSVGDKLGKIVEDVAKDLTAQGKSDGNVNDFMAFMHTYMNDMTTHSIVDEVISVPFQYTDIAGYNYMGHRYDIEHALHPERVIVGSESGIGDIAADWASIQKHPYVIGDFCWTGWEYLGEAGIGMPNYSNGSNPFGNAQFPLQISGTGCIDITGYRLPMSYYREIVFGLRKDPYIAVQDPAHSGEELIRNPWIISDAIGSWSWGAYTGKPVVVEVYSAAEEVELFQNGVSLGRKPAGEAVSYITCFETTYEPGTLTAVAYSRSDPDDGNALTESGRWELCSAGKELRLTLTEEPVYTNELPVPEKPVQETASGSIDLSPFGYTPQNPMSGSATSNQLKAEYEAASIKAREFSERLKANYLKGEIGKPELVLHPADSALLKPQEEQMAGSETAMASEDIRADETSFQTDYEIRYIEIAITDENGILVADQKAELQVTVEGDASVLAFGSADPRPIHNYNEGITTTWLGRAQLILKKPVTQSADAAPVRITVTSDTGLKGEVSLRISEYTSSR